MASYHLAPLEALMDAMESLPGIGPKSAQRMAYHILRMPEEKVRAFVKAITDAHEKIHYCPVCCNLTDGELCAICRDEKRDGSILCVVEDPRDIFALERVKDFTGRYHVLHGAISPMDGIGPEQLKIQELLKRITPEVKEVIMATNATLEGETTAMYIARLLKPLGVRVTRLGHGVPVGGELEYADNVTLQMSLESSKEL